MILSMVGAFAGCGQFHCRDNPISSGMILKDGRRAVASGSLEQF
jgi:hypothetical protein